MKLFYILYALVLCKVLAFDLKLYGMLVLYYAKGLNRGSLHRMYRHWDDKERILIQVPFINEQHAILWVATFIRSTCWPRSNIHIQLLDDSCAPNILYEKRKAWTEEKGFNVSIVKRDNRIGYKAGALNNGITNFDFAVNKYDYIAIFDEDFRPTIDWIYIARDCLRTNPKMGCVQSAWSYSNRYENLITTAASIMLDGHFNIEKSVMQYRNKPMNFNGSAGMWRYDCLKECGFWNETMLSEDTDMSHKAYEHGWTIHYLKDVKCSSLLPDGYRQFINQQKRWCYGGTQATRGWSKLNTIWANMFLWRTILYVLSVGMCFQHVFISLAGYIISWPFLLTLPYWLCAEEYTYSYFRSIGSLLIGGGMIWGPCTMSVLKGLFGKDSEW